MNNCGIKKYNKKITYGSVCSGIEAASVAWEPLGLSPAWFAQFDPEHDYSKGSDFPSAVLSHHWPHVENLGDMTKIADMLRGGSLSSPDILVGGTPCQAFSVAGMRKGLDDARGQLTIKFVEIADEIDKQRGAGNECAILWENVPGVLSSKDNAFGCFLAGLVGEDCELVPPGGKWSNAGCVSGPKRTVAWRILDAQYFGVAQRRRRVFVVASARDWFDPTSVLFEREGVRRDTAPSREKRAEVAAITENCTGTCGAVSVHGTQDPDTNIELAHTLGRNNGQENAVFAFAENSRQEVSLEGGDGQITGALSCGGGKDGHGYPAAMVGMAVRRLTPVECERLQGFPEYKINVTISVSNDGECDDLCSDHPKKSVRVGTKNPKLLRYALSVGGGELPSNARSVGLNFKRDQERPREHVAAHALIDLERMHLQIRSAGKSILSVSIADVKNQSPLPIPSEDFARVAALMMQQAVKITATGRAELPVSATHFSHQESGRMLSKLYGQEISELASDAGLFTRLVSEHLKFITSQAGRNSLNSEQMFSISSCFVAAAISGFIPEQTRKSDSFTLSVTISHGHTNIPVNGKPAADSHRYKALGNSMAVPVITWLGKRIINGLTKK